MSAASCRQPFPSTRLTVTQFAEINALDQDLQHLIREGILESFTDEHGVTRYRPVVKAIARAA